MAESIRVSIEIIQPAIKVQLHQQWTLRPIKIALNITNLGQHLFKLYISSIQVIR